MMEDVDLRRPNYLSYVSGGESDTEGESVCSEAKRFEDFEDRYVEMFPMTKLLYLFVWRLLVEVTKASRYVVLG